jgi:capsular polysaccharide biosynthesis protein
VIYHPAHPGLYAADGSRLEASWPRRGPRREVAAHGPARLPGSPPRRRTSGPLVYLGHPFAKHYGHFLTEGIARLWYAFEDADCALLCHDLHVRNPLARTFLDDFVGALPEVRRRLVAFRRPTRIGTVVLPGPSLSNRCEASDVHARAPEAVARALLGRAPERTGQPLYLSRSRLAGGLRQVRGEAELEARLARAGVAVRHPETLSLRQQIELVNRHAVLVGPTGSALHNLLFGLAPGQPIVHLANRDELPGTYLLIDVVKRAEAHYVAALTTDPDSRKSVSKRDWILDGEAAVAALRTLGVVDHDA